MRLKCYRNPSANRSRKRLRVIRKGFPNGAEIDATTDLKTMKKQSRRMPGNPRTNLIIHRRDPPKRLKSQEAREIARLSLLRVPNFVSKSDQK